MGNLGILLDKTVDNHLTIIAAISGHWGLQDDGPLLGDEDEFEFDEIQDAAFNPDAEAEDFLKHMQAEAAMQQDLSADNADPDPLLLDLRGVPDCSQLKEVFTEAVNVDSPSKDIKADFAEGAMEIPKNLHHALANLQPGVCENDICDSLFRLAMYLRHWRGGCDRMWIKNPRICRNRCGEQLNWYQFLVGAVGCYGMLVLYGLVMFCFSLLFFVLLLFFSSFSFIFSIKSTCNENVVCDGSNSGIFNDFIVMAWAVTQSSLPEN